MGSMSLEKLDAYWRAAKYLSVGQIYLLANPLLREPLRREHIKPRLLGHWGTTPGLNLIYAHLNRVIRERDLNMINVIGPGHGGPGVLANAYLEGTHSEIYPDISEDEEGLARLFRQFSFPRRCPEPRRPRDSRLHSRGGRARVLPFARAARPEARLAARHTFGRRCKTSCWSTRRTSAVMATTSPR